MPQREGEAMRKRAREARGQKKARAKRASIGKSPSGVSRETSKAIGRHPPLRANRKRTPRQDREKTTSLGRGQRNPNGTEHAASGIIERGDFDAGGTRSGKRPKTRHRPRGRRPVHGRVKRGETVGGGLFHSLSVAVRLSFVKDNLQNRTPGRLPCRPAALCCPDAC